MAFYIQWYMAEDFVPTKANEVSWIDKLKSINIVRCWSKKHKLVGFFQTYISYTSVTRLYQHTFTRRQWNRPFAGVDHVTNLPIATPCWLASYCPQCMTTSCYLWIEACLSIAFKVILILLFHKCNILLSVLRILMFLRVLTNVRNFWQSFDFLMWAPTRQTWQTQWWVIIASFAVISQFFFWNLKLF